MVSLHRYTRPEGSQLLLLGREKNRNRKENVLFCGEVLKVILFSFLNCFSCELVSCRYRKRGISTNGVAITTVA